MFLTHQPATDPRPSVAAEVPPDYLDQQEKLRLGQAANRAKAIYPGVVGEVLADECEAAREFSCRFDNGSRTARLVHHLMSTPVPPS